MKNRMSSFINRGNRMIAEGRTDKAVEIMLDGFRFYSDRVIKALYPYAKSDAGMLVIVLRHIADQIEKKNPGAKEFAEEMSKILVFPELEEIEKTQKANRH